MAKAKFRRMLFLGIMAGLTVTLAACEPDDDGQVQGGSLLSEAELGPGWSMTDLAGVEPALLSDNIPELPQALPMQASWNGRYDHAPAYDYAPDTDEYYEPLDESYHTGSSGTDEYLLLALAAGLAGMLDDSPPDYAFGYDDVQPWAWETRDRYVRYAEPVHGGYRYYYYEPDAYRPFLVRDPHYSYGYRDDRLMVIYDRRGRIVDGRRARHQRLAAREYYSRGEHLYRAGHKHRRFGVPARLWDGHRDKIRRERREWVEARRDRDGWQSWDARHRQRLHHDWAGEALVRRKAEQDFAKWQKADYRTPAPKFYSAENRRVQLRKVAELRRQKASGRREERLALIQRSGRDHARDLAQDRNRSREQRGRLERRGNVQSGGFRRASLVTERESRLTDRAGGAKDRRVELRREGDRPQRAERAAERQQKQASKRQERQLRVEAPRQNAARKQRAAVQNERVTERRNQARQIEQPRKEQQVQRADRKRQTARNAQARRDRTLQQAKRETRHREQAKQTAAHEARQEHSRKAQAQARARKERQVRQETRQRQQVELQQKQRAERQMQQRQAARQAAQRRQDADRQQQHRKAERQAQRQQVRLADARSQKQVHHQARQAKQERRRSNDR